MLLRMIVSIEMKKVIALFLLLALLAGLVTVLAACDDVNSSFNMQLVDTNFVFNYAYVRWPDGTTEKLAISAFYHYESGNIQITDAETKIVYVFGPDSCVLAYEP